MISARRAALLGLSVPLSAIMLAVLGLWPWSDDEEPLPVYAPPPSSGGGGGSAKKLLHSREKNKAAAERLRIYSENMKIIATICAAVAEEYA